LAYQLLFDRDYQRRTALLEEALAMARRIGDPSTIVEVIWKLCQSTFVPWTLEERRALSAEAVSISESIDDPLALWGALLCRVTCAFEEADLDEADDLIEQTAQVALEIGQPYLLMWGGQFRLVQALNKGEFDEAERLTTENYERMASTGELDALTMFGAQLLWVRWHQGRLAEFIDLFTEAVANAPDLPAFKSAIDLALVEAGRGDEVTIDLHDIEEMRYDGAWSAGMTVWADVASDLHDVEAAQAIFDRLAPFSSVVAYNMSMGTGSIAHYLGRLATVLQRFDEADTYFKQGLEVNQRLGDPFYIARTELGWGKMLLERSEPGDAERGSALIERARDRAEQYGCAAVARAATELLGN
jgi:tetratricopeptide (TPR) repeat protein